MLRNLPKCVPQVQHYSFFTSKPITLLLSGVAIFVAIVVYEIKLPPPTPTVFAEHHDQERMIWQRMWLGALSGIWHVNLRWVIFRTEVCYPTRPRLLPLTSCELEWHRGMAADKCFSVGSIWHLFCFFINFTRERTVGNPFCDRRPHCQH